ncbi:MAG: prolyl oligopeptidase family serine peptidase [bacterium]
MKIPKCQLMLFIFLLAFPRLTPAQSKLELDVATIMQDPKEWMGSPPNNPYWSEDGKWIYFYWNPEGADADSLYKIALDGTEAMKLSLQERLQIPTSKGEYTRDYRYKLFIRNGDIFLYDKKSRSILQITNTIEKESNVKFSQDERAVIFQRGMNLLRWDRATGATIQITDFRKGKKPKEGPKAKTEAGKYLKQEEIKLIKVLRKRKELRERTRKAKEVENPYAPTKIYIEDKRIENLSLSPDGRYVTLRLREKSKKFQATIVPNYVTEIGYTEDLEARPKVGAPQTPSQFAFVDLERDTLVYIKPDSLPGIFDRPEFAITKSKKDSAKNRSTKKQKPRMVTFFGPYWSEDGKQAFVVVRSVDNKDRWLAILNLPSGQLNTFEHQHDDAWIGGPNIFSWNIPGVVGWMPDNKRVWFSSEESGYSHLYVCNPATGEKRALTQGEFEIYHPHVSRNKKYWYFTSNKVHPGERHFYRMFIEGGPWEKLTSMPGRNDAVMSPNGKKLVIRHSFINKPPELYVQDTRLNAKPRQLTQSTSEKWRSYPWRAAEIVRIPARDGTQLYARLYRPNKPKGAAVIFVHGAGYLQNAHKWWSSYFREYMFHNLLADKGYSVLDIDYRGSAGYGRDWRTAIYRHMGGRDLDDQVDGAKWLVDELNIDPKRIGIYGGSYGGFITFMAMFTAPDVFAAGAALRPVTDWAHYNHPYTSNILNIPQADSTAYRRSSPIYYAEGLKGHLLICHGMIDTNVHFQDTVRLVQRLIELGKTNWEVAIYPLESHGFKEPSSWTDEYRRILKLFEETLN